MSYYTSFESLYIFSNFEINRHTESNSILKEKMLKNDVQKLSFRDIYFFYFIFYFFILFFIVSE
jgi:hypothetical protein